MLLTETEFNTKKYKQDTDLESAQVKYQSVTSESMIEQKKEAIKPTSIQQPETQDFLSKIEQQRDKQKPSKTVQVLDEGSSQALMSQPDTTPKVLLAEDERRSTFGNEDNKHSKKDLMQSTVRSGAVDVPSENLPPEDYKPEDD